MAYLALYRRFRPSGFDSLIGQDHVVRTLVNQINSDKIGHAYLFCGARGTGKTSAAKIFARAINCLSPVNGSPCGKCAVCKALADPSNLDIVEMDAASNNKVENVREIRDKIQYPPVSGKYKVYIIDEVHMLTTEAFNALLKTLEEPPKHAVFILATTEVHKLPSTILSRCMRFDFRLIPTREIAELIGKIYREIGKDYDEDAVNAVARAGNGSVRDALSVADICASYRDGKLTYADVLAVLGATDGDVVVSLLSDIFDSKTGDMLSKVEELADSGKSIGVLCKDIISALRETVICKTCKDAKKILA
ncbi:MAG: DNA polymerase III subunit gamma/tau, partial [Candidatus Borkfalkiaceae bacterium]|nr:DNA polymerase III subunit gamma/tau [Eubacteriales bacterium]MDY5820106.1 DNA polymerase III subunit gamma/tau [Christensenellaceae bacterium]